MTCYNPLIRYESWEQYTCLDGHKAYKAKVFKPDPNYKDEYETIEELANSLMHKNHWRRTQVIPCGKCIGCLLENSRDWATKACYEAELHKDNWFITITYDDEHLPEAEPAIDKETGQELPPNPGGTLKPEELRAFCNKLRMYYRRKYNHQGIRYMAAGEYGSISLRSHYHMILFNCPIKPSEMTFWKYNENHEALWRCTELEKIWKKGMIVAAEVNWNTCAYVARYCMKKSKNLTKEDYERLGIAPEFLRASNRPGIGREYFEKNKDIIYSKDTVIIQKYGGGTMEIRPPKYYDKLYDVENHEKLEKIKERRKKDQERRTRTKYNQTTNYKKTQLWNEEQTKKEQASSLIRTKV